MKICNPILFLALVLIDTTSCNKNIPPTCQITFPINNAEIIQGTIITFTVDAEDEDGSIFSVYYFIDGLGSQAMSPLYNYEYNTSNLEIGSHSIRAQAFNDEGLYAEDEITIYIIEVPNTAPIADFHFSPLQGNTFTIFSFNATSSTDNEDPLDNLQVKWDWESDGIWDTEFNTEKIISHQFLEAGDYQITLEVKDAENLTDQKVKQITILEPIITQVIGTASFPSGTSGDLSNSKVSLYTSLENWNTNNPYTHVLSEGSGSSVTFTLSNINPGNYYLDVWKDIDNNGFWSESDYIGWHGTGGLGNPNLTEFQLDEGESFVANVTMFIAKNGSSLKKP